VGEPGWVTNSRAGEILGWGSGQDSVEELHILTNSLDRAKVWQMRNNGLPEWNVKHIYNQLVDAYSKGNAEHNRTLLPRMEYPLRVLEDWPGTKV
jgi:hypothetical protein